MQRDTIKPEGDPMKDLPRAVVPLTPAPKGHVGLETKAPAQLRHQAALGPLRATTPLSQENVTERLTGKTWMGPHAEGKGGRTKARQKGGRRKGREEEKKTPQAEPDGAVWGTV